MRRGGYAVAMHDAQNPPAPAPGRAPRALLFGGSGPIGCRVAGAMRHAGWQLVALSRQPRASQPGIAWRVGALPDGAGDGAGFDAVVSCGPLDLFSQWYARVETGAARVVAFGSTSVHVKGDSPDAAERALAARLREGEARVAAAAAARGAAATLLRPTLVYGAGGDRNLSRVATLARRHSFFVLPHDARGLRQPVHVDDLAAAALAALGWRGPGVRGYDLPGGETLAYRDMVARVLAALSPPRRLWLLPGPLFSVAALAARGLGLHDAGAAVLARMRQDLAFDAGPARRDLGYAPRAFVPDAGMFGG